ncbi:concanavalin A-like lectin/glucanase domain-containing protein [Vararia minispora EC-137]|uniref:Concanavalin A-like lectin/glucanase domain-containing protein n=1 Tax=Vararia minispora EC-137 TaxID=1314806 RepID=A0ACB8QX14_9AGAM|nr:concanavalin A-like lectin/glucanase domain-containing protein [Vararia minispora EC-137]
MHQARAAEPSPRASTASFRAPFLSPASRPSSAFWSPPAPSVGSATGSSTPLPGPKPPLPSTLLAEKLRQEDKPWLRERDRRSRASYWVTVAVFLLGIAGAAALSWQGWVQGGGAMIPDSQLCSVFQDDFSSLDVDNSGSKWTRNVSLGGFGNNEFEMTTNSQSNLFIKNGQLYIMPTLTTETGGVSYDQLFNGGSISLSGCTAQSKANCTVSSSNSSQTTIPPVQSARLSTMNYASGSIRYGKVEVVAKLPTGDWLWPAIWMLPVSDAYGPWPISGEIDIMEARGNDIAYAQGVNFVRSTLTWGPMESLIARTFGWQSMKRNTFAAGFHTYTLEWTDAFVKMYVDSRLKAMVDVRVQGTGGKSFWDRGSFPQTAQNGSSQAVVENPYGGSSAAPFDQPFYLILDVAAGGTSGWFQDDVGGKPWIDGSATAIRQFAADQPNWSKTWPSDEDQRAFRIDSVKMWKLC